MKKMIIWSYSLRTEYTEGRIRWNLNYATLTAYEV